MYDVHAFMPTGYSNYEINVNCYIHTYASAIVPWRRWGLTTFHFDPVQELGQKERALASWWALDMYSTVHYKVV